jgi:uncharacterized FlaG/YvyC family protein
MSELISGTIRQISGAASRSSADAPKIVLPEFDGKSESSSGNQLPVETAGDEQDLKSLTQNLTAISISIGHDLKFIVDLKSTQPIIQVLDSETGEVIRQIPSTHLTTYPLSSGLEAIRLLDTVA